MLYANVRKMMTTIVENCFLNPFRFRIYFVGLFFVILNIVKGEQKPVSGGERSASADK